MGKDLSSPAWGRGLKCVPMAVRADAGRRPLRGDVD